MAPVNDFDPKLMDLRAALAEVQRLLEHQAPQRAFDQRRNMMRRNSRAAVLHLRKLKRRTWDKCPFTQQG